MIRAVSVLVTISFASLLACAGPQAASGAPDSQALQLSPDGQSEKAPATVAPGDSGGGGTAKAGTALQVFLSGANACALLPEGIRCWGAVDGFFEGSFKQVVIGRQLLLLSDKGEVYEFGTRLARSRLPIRGRVRMLAAAELSRGPVCAIVEPDGHIECVSSPVRMDGNFESVTLAGYDSQEIVCGLNGRGVQCIEIVFGRGVPVREPFLVAQGKFTEIAGNCGLRSTGALECWWGEKAKSSYGSRTFPTFERLFSADRGRVCGVSKAGVSGCWSAGPEITNAKERFESLFIMSNAYGCGVRDGRIECWGASNKLTTPPSELGSFRAELSSPELAQKFPAKPRCEKLVDFKNFTYPASKLAQAPFELKDGRHRITTKQVDPKTNFFGASEEGTEHQFAGVQWVDLGTGPAESALVAIDVGDFNIFHGNSVPPAEPYVWYAVRVDQNCRPEVVGSVYVEPEEETVFERQMVILTHEKSKLSRGWAIRDGKFQEIGRGAAFGPAPEPKPVCNKAEYLAKLGSLQGSRGNELSGDPCFGEALDRAVGAHKKEFLEASGFGLSVLQSEDGYLLGDSCQVHYCGFNRSALAISLETGDVFAAIVTYKRPTLWLGKPSPAPLKRMAAEMRATVDEQL